jgi:hypothetical protein
VVVNGEQQGDALAADTGDEHREVYARFGLAYCLAECVHRGLVSAFAYLPYDRTTAPRPWIEERFQRASAMTLGELATQTKPGLPDGHHGLLEWAVTRRNHLAHGLWYERTHEMLDVAGRQRLVAFLEETADRLEDLNREVEAVVMAHLESLGVTPEMLQQAMTEVTGHPPDPPLDRRPGPTSESKSSKRG